MAPQRRKPWTIHLAAIICLLLPRAALANGRFPETLNLHFEPVAGGRIVGSATFGLLISDDQGTSWQWVCEDSIGYQGVWDPQFVLSAQGTLFASTPSALRLSRDGGCTFENSPGTLGSAWISDLHEAQDGAIWIATGDFDTANDLHVTRDDGLTFAAQGLEALYPTAIWKSVRSAPSDPTTLYATGYYVEGSDPRPLLLRHDAAGWIQIPFTRGSDSQLLILGVSPTDPDLVFMRVFHDPQDIILRSDDGGVSWSEVTSFEGPVQIFVAWPDGEIYAATKYAGSQRSLDSGLTWASASLPREAPSGRCGVIAPNGELWGCLANWDPDRMAYAKSVDRGRTWSKLMRFNEIMAPLDCPTGTPQDELCEPAFAGSICQAYGCGTVDASPMPLDAPPSVDGGPRLDGGDGGGACGCGVALAGAIVLPIGLRRRTKRTRSDR